MSVPMSKDVSPSPKVVEDEEPMCSICCGELTVKNIVNPECGHATCKDCFWRWAKDKNSCPFCRTNLLKNTEEAQEIQQMRSLLEHRTRIIRQVESAYDEEDRIKADVRRLKRNVGAIRSQVLKFEQLKKEEHQKLLEIKKANGGTYQTFMYFKEKIASTTLKNRQHRDFVRGQHSYRHIKWYDHYNHMKGALRDIKILRRTAGGPWEYGWFCKPKLDKVREMNRVRKERQEFRRKRDIFNEWGAFQGLDRLFREEEQQEEYPSHMAVLFERIVEIVDNSNNQINIEDNNGNIIADYNRDLIGFLREAFPGGHISRHNIHPRD